VGGHSDTVNLRCQMDVPRLADIQLIEVSIKGGWCYLAHYT